jgi:hypothetical protein
MKLKLSLIILSAILLVASAPTTVLADACSDCVAAGRGAECAIYCGSGGNTEGNTGALGGLGSVTNPIPTSSTAPGGGLITLLNNVLRLVFVGAGIYAFIRIIVAGLGFINAGGDVKKITVAWNAIWQSLLGLIVIIGSFAIAGLIGQVLYGDWTAILSPKIYGPN